MAFFTRCDASKTAGWLAEDHVATNTEDDRLRMAEHCGDLHAARALDVHEERVGALDQSFELALTLLFLQ